VKTAVLVSRLFHEIVLQFMPNHVHDGPPYGQGLTGALHGHLKTFFRVYSL